MVTERIRVSEDDRGIEVDWKGHHIGDDCSPVGRYTEDKEKVKQAFSYLRQFKEARKKQSLAVFNSGALNLSSYPEGTILKLVTVGAFIDHETDSALKEVLDIWVAVCGKQSIGFVESETEDGSVVQIDDPRLIPQEFSIGDVWHWSDLQDSIGNTMMAVLKAEVMSVSYPNSKKKKPGFVLRFENLFGQLVPKAQPA